MRPEDAEDMSARMIAELVLMFPHLETLYRNSNGLR